MDEEITEGRGSIIPPGHVDLALLLARLPQVSEYDTSVDLDQLTASGLNHIARETGDTIDNVAKKAAWLYLRMYFAQKGLYNEEQLHEEANKEE